MKYRKFDNIEWKVSVLGFGITLLPVRGQEKVETCQAESIRMIRYAIDHGVNYLDLGYPYNMEQQERVLRVIGRALKDGYRQKIKISVTVPTAFIHSTQDFDQYLNKQMEWLDTERIDFCLFGRINRENWPKLQALGGLNWADRSINDGRIDNVGFSFHDHFQILRNVLNDYHHWTLCHFQYSYMDVARNPGVNGIKYAADKGLAVVITDPLRGGRLINNLPDSVARIWAGALTKRTPAELGLRFAWNYPETSSVVCDMGTMEQLVQYLTYTDSAEPNGLTIQEEVILSQVSDEYRRLAPINCASCRPCMPCPQGIDVPRIFEIYNDAIIYNDIETAAFIYHNERHNAGSCIECRLCEKACIRRPPLPIVSWLKKVDEMFQ